MRSVGTHCTACRPMMAKGRFAAAAAMSVGAYGGSCREQPDKVMECMRRWVRHAVWSGGPAADYRIVLGRSHPRQGGPRGRRVGGRGPHG